MARLLLQRTLFRIDADYQVVNHLVHRTRRFGAPGLADDPGRHAGDGDIIGHGFYDNRAGGNPGTVPDLDVAQDFCAGADHYAATNFRVPVAELLAGAAERYIV